MTPLLCLAAMLLFGYVLGFAAKQTDWDALSNFRINVFQRCAEVELKNEQLTSQLEDYEHRLQAEHELRRALEKRVRDLEIRLAKTGPGGLLCRGCYTVMDYQDGCWLCNKCGYNAG